MGLYEDSDHRFVLVVEKNVARVAFGKALNATGHALAGLVAKLSTRDLPPFLAYPAQDGFFANIAKNPVIVLQADNGNQLLTCYQKARSAGIDVNPFVEAMIGANAESQQAATFGLPINQHSFIALAMFGSADDLKPLTKRFSLMRTPVLLSD